MTSPKSQLKNYFLTYKPISNLNPEKKRILIAALLASVFLVVTIFNTHLMSSKRVSSVSSSITQASRTIASRQPTALRTSFEKSVIERFTQNLTRAPIHIAQRPTQIENLVFGTLAGSYLISTQSGKIAGISLGDKDNLYFNPQKISPASFLMDHKSSFIVKFDKVFKTIEHSTSESKQEEFDLLNTQNQRVGLAIFTFDKRGHLVSLKIDRSQTLAAF